MHASSCTANYQPRLSDSCHVEQWRAIDGIHRPAVGCRRGVRRNGDIYATARFFSLSHPMNESVEQVGSRADTLGKGQYRHLSVPFQLLAILT